VFQEKKNGVGIKMKISISLVLGAFFWQVFLIQTLAAQQFNCLFAYVCFDTGQECGLTTLQISFDVERFDQQNTNIVRYDDALVIAMLHHERLDIFSLFSDDAAILNRISDVTSGNPRSTVYNGHCREDGR